MKITIDKVEGNIAVVISDDGKNFNIPYELLSGGKEGDVFDISPDKDETKTRKERIEKLANELWE